jgi:hypothetical protein
MCPHIRVVHREDIPPDNFLDFADLIHQDGLDYKCEAVPKPGPYACIEWLLPTVVVVFIAKAYFDGFLKEAGKDHYQLLKTGLVKLSERFNSTNKPETKLVFTKGKAKDELPKYSLVYSVYAELEEGISVKLLLQSDFNAEQCNEALSCFLDFLQDAHEGNLSPSSVNGLANAQLVGRTLLIAYSPEFKQLEVVDPIPRSARDKIIKNTAG